MNSGLYAELIQKKLLVKHSEVKEEKNNPPQYKRLLVEKIPEADAEINMLDFIRLRAKVLKTEF